MNEKVIKSIGMGLSVIGVAISITTNILEDKKLDLKIAKEVSKHLKKELES